MPSILRHGIDQEIQLAIKVGASVIEYMPSFMLTYFERAKELGIDIRETKLRLAIGIGEPWSEANKKNFFNQYGLPYYSWWGSMDMGIIGSDCEARTGMHLFADRYIIEVVDPETGEPLPDGEEGEFLITPLLNQSMPLIRYRPGDVGRMFPYEPCSCGRTLPKMSSVRGRVSQRINIRGKKILPLDVEEIVAGIEGLAGDYLVDIYKKGEMERLRVKMEYKPDVKNLNRLKDSIHEAFHWDYGIESEVELVPKGSLTTGFAFKTARVIKTYE
ncbi:MAG: hypothetical protein SVY10_05890 [Thermodesulfobacteriota bacterium]|nr:hypothetical protein [Thermodesulfobacteriota bacterium]